MALSCACGGAQQIADAVWMSMLLSAFAGVLAVTVVVATFYFIRCAPRRLLPGRACLGSDPRDATLGFGATSCASDPMHSSVGRRLEGERVACSVRWDPGRALVSCDLLKRAGPSAAPASALQPGS